MDNTSSTPLASQNSQEKGMPVAPAPLWGTQLPLEREEEELDFSEIWSVIKQRQGLIALVALGVLGAIALWTFRKTPIYQGSFQILVGDPIQETNSVDNAILQRWFISDTDYNTQIEVLRSSSVMEPAIAKLQEKYPDLEYNDLIRGKKSPLAIQQLEDSKILEVSYLDEDPKKIGDILNLLSNTYLQYSLKQRQNEITQGLNYVTAQLPGVRKHVNQRQAQLQQFRQKYKLLDPAEHSKQLSEKLIILEERFLDTEIKLKDANSLYAVLQQQVGLDPKEAISSSYLSESPRYQNLLNQLQEVEIELAKQSAVFLPNNPTIEILQEKRANLLPLLQQEAQKILGSQFTKGISDSPAETSPSSLRLNLNQQLVQSANEIQVLQVRRLALERELENLKQRIAMMPVLDRQYTELQRDLKVATDSLDRFLESEQNLQLESAQKNLPWQIISKPTVEETPVSPKPVRNLALGTIAGLLLGLGAAFLADRLDPTFHSLEEFKQENPFPLLGTIPLQKDLSTLEKVMEATLPQLQIGDASFTLSEFASKRGRGSYGYFQGASFLEAFRSLTTNIRLLGSDRPTNSLTVTSALPAAGKSTVALNLAKAAAAMGQRVLLVDADLRQPQIHERLNLPNTQGLSNVLATGLPLEEAVQAAPRRENLWILTAGEIPPDPTRLLSSERMGQVQAQLAGEGKYDLIVYDTPPLSFADSRILGPLTSGIVLIARVGKTDRPIWRQTIDELNLAQVPVLGVVVNCVPQSRHSYYHYNRYYRDRQDKFSPSNGMEGQS